ncbi:MAG: hypothetical protein ABS934_05495 [Psychrobacillus sp.]
MEFVLLWILSFIILYVVIFTAVKDAIDKSRVGKIIIKKYGTKDELVPLSDLEIEKELENEERN